MDPVVHFEMPYEDRDRAADFYTSAFGWQCTKFGEEMGNYLLAGTSETDATRRPTKPGVINGGFYPKSAGMPSEPSVVIAVQDLGNSMEKVKSAGGQVLGEPMDIPSVGKYVAIKDTEGNRVGMLQPSMGG